MVRLLPEGRPPALALWLTGEPVCVSVSGTSMEPTLRTGDRVEVVRASREELLPGDLVVFERAGEVTVHRLLAMREERFLEKGDAHPLGVWHPWPEILGKVVAVSREGPGISTPEPFLAGYQRKLGRRHFLRHALTVRASSLPSAPFRRLALGLLRRLPDRVWNGGGDRTKADPP
jgi:hypothetical protein